MSEEYERRIAELETEYSEACEQAEIADIRLRDVMQDIARLRVARIAELETQLADRDAQVTALREFAVLATRLLARPSIALRYISFPHYQRFCELAESVISDEMTLKRLGEANDFARNQKVPDGE